MITVGEYLAESQPLVFRSLAARCGHPVIDLPRIWGPFEPWLTVSAWEQRAEIDRIMRQIPEQGVVTR